MTLWYVNMAIDYEIPTDSKGCLDGIL